ncbi:MAG: AAA family ATPase [Hadesarchaea archaeon]|nr:AAA family ATPase [Hadesarchaea archaeon]
MYSYVFILGRPGSGKSIIYKKISKRLLEKNLIKEIERIDDFPVLLELLEEDEELENHVKKEGGFEITNLDLLDEVLQRINKRVKKQSQPDKLIFIEFSRDNYEHALTNFDQELLNQSLIIYVYCPFDVCVKRNVERFEESQESIDNHIVPTDMMKKYYKEDDYEDLYLESGGKLKEKAPADLVVINNDEENMAKLERELNEAEEKIKKSKN